MTDLKTATPDASLPDGGFLFGADSQSADAPSIYALTTLRDKLLGASDFSGNTVTTDTPLLNMLQTWNEGSTAFTAWKLNVTDTASDAASKLLDLQVGGATKFSVWKNGFVSVTDRGDRSPTIGPFRFETSAEKVHFVAGARQTHEIARDSYVQRAGNFFGFSSSNQDADDAPADVRIYRDAANTLAQRNGTNSQTFRLYKSYTDVSNSQYLELSSGTIAMRGAGTGDVNQDLTIHAGASGSLELGSEDGAKFLIRSYGEFGPKSNGPDFGILGNLTRRFQQAHIQRVIASVSELKNETAAPTADAAGIRLGSRDNGGTRELVAVMPGGTIVVLASE